MKVKGRGEGGQGGEQEQEQEQEQGKITITATSTATATTFQGVEGECGETTVNDLTAQMTKFLSLDKCLPRRSFLELVKVKANKSNVDYNHNGGDDDEKEEEEGEDELPKLEYDLEWLAILRKTCHLTQPRNNVNCPDFGSVHATEAEILAVKEDVLKHNGGSLLVPNNFEVTARTSQEVGERYNRNGSRMLGNPQTDKLFEILKFEHVLTVPYNGSENELMNGVSNKRQKTVPDVAPANDDDEIDLDEEDEEEAVAEVVADDDDEISLGD